MNNKMMLNANECIYKLKEWKEYPFFRAETRVDWILSLAIPYLLQMEFGSECELILPEFPIRKGIIDERYENEGNRSIKIDYYCLLRDETHVLVELKTDIKSINKMQIEYYQRIVERRVYDIFNEIRILRNSSKHKKKYDKYIDILKKHNLIDDSGISQVSKESKFKIVYISPNGKRINGLYCYKLRDLGEILQMSEDCFIKGIGQLIKTW